MIPMRWHSFSWELQREGKVDSSWEEGSIAVVAEHSTHWTVLHLPTTGHPMTLMRMMFLTICWAILTDSVHSYWESIATFLSYFKFYCSFDNAIYLINVLAAFVVKIMHLFIDDV